MKFKIYGAFICLILTFGTQLNAQNTYNYSQSYSSMNNVLAKQQAEWRATEQHYRNISSSNRSSGSYSSSSSSGGYDQGTIDAFERMFFPKRYAREQASKREAAYTPAPQKSTDSYYRYDPAPAVNYAQEERERREAAEKAERERKVRVDYWVKKLKEDPLQTIETAPTFNNKQAMYEWHYQKAINGNDIFREDPYAKLVAARLLWDAEATKGLNNRLGDTSTVVSFLKDAPVCALRYCLTAEVLMADKDGPKYTENIFNGLHIATRLNDKTQGDTRAYKQLLKLYRRGTIFGKPIPREINFIADTYAWAARQGDVQARQELIALLEDSVDFTNIPAFHLTNITKTFDPNTPDGFWYIKAKAELIRRDADDLDSLDITSMDGWIKSRAVMEAKVFDRILPIFNTYQLENKPLHKDMLFAAEVYLQAASKGNAAAKQQLLRLLPLVPMKKFDANQLLMLKAVLPGTKMEDEITLWAMLQKGRQQQVGGDSNCFATFRKAFAHPKQNHPYTQAMQTRALYLCLNDKRFTNKLSQAEFVKAHKAAIVYIPTLEKALKETSSPAKDDIQLLFSWFAGHMMNAAAPDKASGKAFDMALEGDFTLFKETGIHYRWGKNGWPKKDSSAMTYFDMALIPLKNENNSEGKARLAETHAEIASYWVAYPAAGMQANHDQRNIHLEAAAKLDSRYHWLYAQFLAENSPYQSNTKAALHTQKAINHLKKVRDLFVLMDDPKIIAQADAKLAVMEALYKAMML